MQNAGIPLPRSAALGRHPYPHVGYYTHVRPGEDRRLSWPDYIGYQLAVWVAWNGPGEQ